MGRHKKVCEKERQKIVEKYKSGVPIRDISPMYPVSKSTIRTYLRDAGVPPNKNFNGVTRHSYDKKAFSTINEKSAYWIGFIMADGSVTTQQDHSCTLRICLDPDDKRHLEKFRSFLRGSQEINKISYQNPLYCIRVHSQKIVQDLSKYGIVPNKSKTANVKQLTRNRHFWRGMIDGDGYVTKEGVGLTGSKQNVKKFKNFCQQVINTKASVRPCNGSYAYAVSYGSAGSVVKRLYRWQSIALDRKYKKAKDNFLKGRYYPQL